MLRVTWQASGNWHPTAYACFCSLLLLLLFSAYKTMHYDGDCLVCHNIKEKFHTQHVRRNKKRKNYTFNTFYVTSEPKRNEIVHDSVHLHSYWNPSAFSSTKKKENKGVGFVEIPGWSMTSKSVAGQLTFNCVKLTRPLDGANLLNKSSGCELLQTSSCGFGRQKARACNLTDW